MEKDPLAPQFSLTLLPSDWLINDALAMLAGQEALYRRLIYQFADRYDGADKRLTAFLESGDLQEAHRLVHSVKSLSASMGNVALNNASITLEADMARGKKRPSEEAVADFNQELKFTLTTLHELTGMAKQK